MNNARPRPIIVRFSFYKDKELVLQKANLLKGSVVNVSQDFSKATLDIHRQLRDYAKAAQENFNTDESETRNIVRHRVTYRRVVLTYTTNKSVSSAPTFSRTYNLDYIKGNRKWYIPPAKSSS